MPPFAYDLRHALRSLLRSRLLFVAAVLTIAISIGLNSAVFSVLDAVVLRPLPVAEPERLVALCETEKGDDGGWCSASVPNIADIGARAKLLSTVGVAREWSFVLRTTAGAEGVRGGLISAEAFAAVGIKPFRGRLIETADVGAAWRRVIVLSHEEWVSRFQQREDAIGQSIVVDGEAHTIVGVLPPNAVLPRLEQVQMWRPVHVASGDETQRDWRGFQVYGLLRPGVTLAAAQRELTGLADQLKGAQGSSKVGWSVQLHRWQDVIAGPLRNSMYLLQGAVAFLLLIGCANVSNLLLARSVARRQEMAVRAALGASGSDLIRGVLAESLVIAVIGSAIGLVVAAWTAKAIVALAPSGIPRLDQVRLDFRVIASAAVLAFIVTLLVGILPARRTLKLDLRTTMGTRGASSSLGVTGALVTAEIALAFVLVTGAGLLGRSFTKLASWSPGFEQEHLVTAWLLPSAEQLAADGGSGAYFARVREAALRVPAVKAAATGSAGPLFGGDGESHIAIEGRAPEASERETAFWFDVSPDYFRTFGIPIVEGREITESDTREAPKVVVVNETFVRRYLGGRAPLGRQVTVAEQHTTFMIVGVVRDVPPVNPNERTAPQMFWPTAQLPRGASYIMVRADGDPTVVGAELRRSLRSLDPSLQVTAPRTMKDWLGRELVRPRFAAVLLGVFGFVGLVLAAIATYAVLAYSVVQARKEIGVKAALGASGSDIIREVFRRGVTQALVGVSIGLFIALGVTRLLGGMLAGVSPLDPVSLGVSGAVLLLTASAACLVPAWRASRVDPVAVLRGD